MRNVVLVLFGDRASRANKGAHIRNTSCAVEVKRPCSLCLLDKALILSCLLALFDLGDGLRDRVQDQVLQAFIDEPVRLGQLIEEDRWVSSGVPVVLGRDFPHS